MAKPDKHILQNHIGSIVGNLTILGPENKIKSKKRYIRSWYCKCSCGRFEFKSVENLFFVKSRKHTLSCTYCMTSLCFNISAKRINSPEWETIRTATFKARARARHEILIGKRINKLTVIALAEPLTYNNKQYSAVTARCDCGKVLRIQTKHVLKSKGCRSCAVVKHGLTHKPFYQLWRSILFRTTNPKCKMWHRYGKLGIKLCDKWKNDPEAFMAWMSTNLGPCPEGKSLDRIDTAGDYTPGNLKWSTSSEQNLNRASGRTQSDRFIQGELRSNFISIKLVEQLLKLIPKKYLSEAQRIIYQNSIK